MFNRFKTAPWRKVFKSLGWFALVLTILIGVPSGVMQFSEGGFGGFGLQLLLAGMVSLLLALQGLLMFTATWVMYDVPKDWAATKQFFKDLPANAARAWRGVCTATTFALSLPGKCIRGIAAAFRWVVGLPKWWRSLSEGERREIIFGSVFGTLLLTVGYFMWPVAQWCSETFVASWVPDSSRLMAAIVFDVVLSSLALVFAAQILRGIAEVVMGFFRKET
jgi:hypothetical protein